MGANDGREAEINFMQLPEAFEAVILDDWWGSLNAEFLFSLKVIS